MGFPRIFFLYIFLGFSYQFPPCVAYFTSLNLFMYSVLDLICRLCFLILESILLFLIHGVQMDLLRGVDVMYSRLVMKSLSLLIWSMHGV